MLGTPTSSASRSTARRAVEPARTAARHALVVIEHQALLRIYSCRLARPSIP